MQMIGLNNAGVCADGVCVQSVGAGLVQADHIIGEQALAAPGKAESEEMAGTGAAMQRKPDMRPGCAGFSENRCSARRMALTQFTDHRLIPHCRCFLCGASLGGV